MRVLFLVFKKNNSKFKITFAIYFLTVQLNNKNSFSLPDRFYFTFIIQNAYKNLGEPCNKCSTQDLLLSFILKVSISNYNKYGLRFRIARIKTALGPWICKFLNFRSCHCYACLRGVSDVTE